MLRGPQSLSPLAASLFLVLASMANAQTPPTGEDLLREAEKASSRTRRADLPPPAQPAPSRPGAGAAVVVQRFEVLGVKLLDAATVQAVLKPWVGQKSDLVSLQRAADALVDAYRRSGYLARAWLPEQEIRDGVVLIRVAEGRLSGLRIENRGAPRALPEPRIREFMLARQREGEALRTDDIQRAVTLLNEMPGMRAASVLEPGENDGDSRIVVAVTDAPLVTGSALLDNAGARATGEARAAVNLALNGPLARGDQWTLGTFASKGSKYARAGLSLPVGNDGMRASAQVSALHYGYDLNAVRYAGNASTLGGTLNYPVQRSAERNLSLQGTLERKRFKNRVAGIELSRKHIDLLTLGFNLDRLDDWAGGGVWIASGQLAAGRLDLGGNAADLASDQLAGGPQRNGGFAKVSGTLTRMQRLSAQQTLTVAASGQIASKNLDSSEKLQVSGPYAVRAYSVSEPSVDTGVLLTADWKYKFSDTWAVTVFHDQAMGWRDEQVNVATLQPNRLHVRGSGLELNWEAPGAVQVRAGVARRHGVNPTRNPVTLADADGTRKETRALLSVSKWF
ncbi:ShlB/FhaC/HecB family hemolysin secretion/activation protein [Roseateles sp. DC23W]|uniref:ShlB/FhaC/HecB family hemolysin secretion/activation protein n=1 Tax=Pelomonas dachongensis TaxID=3299029 RepID=A0ABW7EPR9_9BURK